MIGSRLIAKSRLTNNLIIFKSKSWVTVYTANRVHNWAGLDNRHFLVITISLLSNWLLLITYICNNGFSFFKMY
jgi:hypothetical protein